MHTGMLWFDNSSGADLILKIQPAIEYYRRKFKREPNLCLVHPGMLSNGPLHVGHTVVRAYEQVLPHHLWIGVEDED